MSVHLLYLNFEIFYTNSLYRSGKFGALVVII